MLFVLRSRMTRRVLVILPRHRMRTKPLPEAAFGAPSNTGLDMLRRREALGLIRRYSGHNEDGHFVVWNEITPLGRRVLGLVEGMKEG